ncbi:uncharacterized protein LOC126904287 [Daktulosphaira vitifoliae]|uniref:uncharacterized protein LOC126904287 n=1 Tax=Daktulosphaira vitifoliae TaxID=58002 RepID=UPI0021AA9394|nr:uncharacterized protein LOC126904287 [Daktulosphaira vitifoliae]
MNQLMQPHDSKAIRKQVVKKDWNNNKDLSKAVQLLPSDIEIVEINSNKSDKETQTYPMSNALELDQLKVAYKNAIMKIEQLQTQLDQITIEQCNQDVNKKHLVRVIHIKYFFYRKKMWIYS